MRVMRGSYEQRCHVKVRQVVLRNQRLPAHRPRQRLRQPARHPLLQQPVSRLRHRRPVRQKRKQRPFVRLTQPTKRQRPLRHVLTKMVRPGQRYEPLMQQEEPRLSDPLKAGQADPPLVRANVNVSPFAKRFTNGDLGPLVKRKEIRA